jgi:hypothetical protein
MPQRAVIRVGDPRAENRFHNRARNIVCGIQARKQHIDPALMLLNQAPGKGGALGCGQAILLSVHCADFTRGHVDQEIGGKVGHQMLLFLC